MTATLELGTLRASAGLRTSDEALHLPAKALLRHMMALGSSGSGKTVLCKIVVEECVRAGIPALVLDPQGDLCSLALAADDPEQLVERGVDPELAREFADKADVVVFTPGSDKGIALGVDPLAAAHASAGGRLDDETCSRVAGMIASLLGYELDDDDGAGFVAVLDTILRELGDEVPSSLVELTTRIAALDDAALRPYTKFWDVKKIKGAVQKLARLEVGPRRRLFTGGVPLDIDVLLGLTGDAATPKGKVRVAVVYLNALHAQEDKEFLVAALAERLYAWMLAHPSKDPQALFYLDEIAPYMPPVRKPQCKDSLQLVFKQARKYGVCCLMATQNPGDVDYRAMAQFGTWALGRLTTKQDLEKVTPTIEALAGAAAPDVLSELPRLEPGQFVLLSPDHLERPSGLQSRWLYSQHQTLDESKIATLCDERWRERFAGSQIAGEAKASKKAASKAAAKKASKTAEQAEPEPDADERETDEREVEAPAKKKAAKKATAKQAAKTSTAKQASRETLAYEPAPVHASVHASAPVPASTPVHVPVPASAPVHAPAPLPPRMPEPEPMQAELALIRAQGPLDAKRLAELLGCGETRARKVIETLVERGALGSFKQGRSLHYWVLDQGTRPDLGMPEQVQVATPLIDQAQATVLAQTHLQSTLFGLGGPAETIVNLALVHRLLWRVDFEERVETGLLGRLLGPGHEDRIGSVYLHPRTLLLLVYDRQRGLRLVDVQERHASEVHDIDGIVRFTRLAPAGLRLDESEWRERKNEAAVVAAFKTRFAARVASVVPVFVPLWKAMIRRTQPEGMRVILLDAIAGHLVDWT